MWHAVTFCMCLLCILYRTEQYWIFGKEWQVFILFFTPPSWRGLLWLLGSKQRLGFILVFTPPSWGSLWLLARDRLIRATCSWKGEMGEEEEEDSRTAWSDDYKKEEEESSYYLYIPVRSTYHCSSKYKIWHLLIWHSFGQNCKFTSNSWQGNSNLIRSLHILTPLERWLQVQASSRESDRLLDEIECRAIRNAEILPSCLVLK